MCWICGAVTTNGSRLDEPALRRMTDGMSHQGPDESGLYLRQGPGMSMGFGKWADYLPAGCTTGADHPCAEECR